MEPGLNRGTTFTAQERASPGLEALRPAAVGALEEQAKRGYEECAAQPTDLAKNDYLAALHDRNEVLYSLKRPITDSHRSRTRND